MDDLLMLFAELEIAVAGFTAIISVFGPDRGESRGIMQAIRIKMMLETSIHTMFASLFPLLLGTLGLPPWVTWRVAGSVMAVLAVLLWVRQLHQIRGRDIENAQGYSHRAAKLTKGMASFGIICFLVATVLPRSGPVASVYTVGVFNGLCFAAIQFVRAATAAMDFGRSEGQGA